MNGYDDPSPKEKIVAWGMTAVSRRFNLYVMPDGMVLNFLISV